MFNLHKAKKALGFVYFYKFSVAFLDVQTSVQVSHKYAKQMLLKKPW